MLLLGGLVGSLQLTSVQNFVLRQTEYWLSEKLDTKLSLGTIAIDFSEGIQLQNCYLEDQKGDTLAAIGNLYISTNLWRLFSQKVTLRELRVENITLKLEQTNQTFNFDFIEKAFPSDNTDNSPSKWRIEAKGATVVIQNLKFQFKDNTQQTLTQSTVNQCVAVVDTIDLTNSSYALQSLTVDNSRYAFQPLFRRNSAFPKKQFDANDYEFSEIAGKVADLKIQENNIIAKIEQLSAKEKCGLSLKNFASDIAFYNYNHFVANNYFLKLNESTLGGRIDLILPDATQPLETLQLKVNINSKLKCSDLLFFTNDTLIAKNKADECRLFAQVEGSLAALAIHKFELDYNTKNQFYCNGLLKNCLSPSHIFADINIQNADIQLDEVIDWAAISLPEMLLPSDKLSANGKVNVSPNENKFDVKLSYHRANEALISTWKGQILSKDFVPKDLDIVIEKVTSSKQLLTDLIPKNILPEGVQLPDTVLLYGSIKGQPDSLRFALNIEAERAKGNSSIQFNAFLMPQKKPSPLIQMQQFKATLAPDEIWAWLPSQELKKTLVLNDKIPISADFKGNSSIFNGNIEVDLGEKGQFKSHFSSKGNGIAIKGQTTHFDFSTFLTDSIKSFLGLQNPLPIDADFNYRTDTLSNFSTDFNMAQLTFGKPSKKTATAASFSEDDNFEEIQSSENEEVVIADYPFYLKNIKGEAKGNFNKNQFEHIKLAFFLRDKRVLNTLPTHSEVQLDLNIEKAILEQNAEPNLKGNLMLKDIFVETKSNERDENLPEDVTFSAEEKKRPSAINTFFNFSPQSDSLQVKSDWVNFDVNGHFDITNVSTHFQSFINDYFHRSDKSNSFASTDFLSFKGNFQPNAIVPKPLFDTWKLPNNTIFQGGLTAENHRANLYFQADTLNMNNMAYRAISFNVEADEKSLRYDLKMPMYQASTNSYLQNLIKGDMKNDRLSIAFSQKDSLSQPRYKVGMELELKNNVIEASFNAAPLINFQKWAIDAKNKIFYNLKNNDLSVENLAISQHDLAKNYVAINGNSRQNILIDCKDFRLNSLGSVLYADTARFGGFLNGKIKLENLFQQPKISADLKAQQLAFQGADFGDVVVAASTLFNSNNTISEGDFSINLDKNDGKASIEGRLLANDSLDIHGLFNRFDCATLLPLAQPTFVNLAGRATGYFDVGGSLNNPIWEGQLKLNDFCFKPAANMVSYCLKEEIIPIKKEFIAFSNLKIQDENGGIATINGKITPIEFPNLAFDLALKANDFLVLNNQKDKKSNYQGFMKADMKGFVKGTSELPDLYLSLAVKDNSKITYRYDGGATAKDYGDGLIVFGSKNKQNSAKIIKKVEKPFTYKLNMDLADNENLLFKTLIDPVKGDLFEGKGIGNLHLSLQPDGSMNLVGKYALSSGKYIYALNNIIKRTFEVKNGSNLSWTGNPYNPELDITANYIVKTYPPPNTAADSTKVTFITAIETTGTLEKPSINFKIKYPTGEEGLKYGNVDNSLIQAELDNINNNSSELSGTVISLLTLNTFPSTGGYNLGVDLRLTNLLSNQLNTFTKDIKFVDLSFNASDINGQNPNAIGINIGKDFFNKRLKINMSSSALGNNSRLFQNVVATYALKNNKDWKFKAAYEGEDNLIFQDNPSNKFGIGLTYNKSFNRLKGKKSNAAFNFK